MPVGGRVARGGGLNPNPPCTQQAGSMCVGRRREFVTRDEKRRQRVIVTSRVRTRAIINNWPASHGRTKRVG